MKEGWEYKKLGEVATFIRGLTYSKNDEAEISDNIVLRSNNVDLSTGIAALSMKSPSSCPHASDVIAGMAVIAIAIESAAPITFLPKPFLLTIVVFLLRG